MEPARVKKCSKCKSKKLISEFHKDKSRKDKLACQCKKCVAKYRADPENKKRKVSISAKMRAQSGYKKKKVKWDAKYNAQPWVKKRKAKWHANNNAKPDVKKKNAKQRAELIIRSRANPEFVDVPQEWYLKQVKCNAQARDLDFNLTYQDLLNSNHSQNCKFCGTKLKFTKMRLQSPGNQTASLDRIDSSKGYETGNIQWTCINCNLMKKNFTDERFIKHCTEVARNNKN